MSPIRDVALENCRDRSYPKAIAMMRSGKNGERDTDLKRLGTKLQETVILY